MELDSGLSLNTSENSWNSSSLDHDILSPTYGVMSPTTADEPTNEPYTDESADAPSVATHDAWAAEFDPLTEEQLAAFNAEPEAKVVTFRTNNHAFPVSPSLLGTTSCLYQKQPEFIYEDMLPKQSNPIHKSLHWLLMFTYAFIVVHNIVGSLFLLGGYIYVWVACSWTTVAIATALLGAYVTRLMDRKPTMEAIRSSISTYFQKHWVWNLTQEWGNMEIVRTAKLDPKKQYVFGVYPHGILIHSRLVFWGGVFSSLFPGLTIPRILAASVLFNIPCSREMCLSLGAVDASRRSAKNAIASGVQVGVYPGGTAEILTTNPESKKTTLLSRSGFVRLAIEQGVPLVPVFAFGEKYFYRRIYLPRIVSTLIYKLFKLPIVLFGGVLATWLPFRGQLTVIFGTPIEVRKDPNPSNEYVAEVLAKFMVQEQNLFHTFKPTVGYSDDEVLEIVDAKVKTKRI